MVNRFMTSGDPVPSGDARSEIRLLGSVPSLKDAPASLLGALVDAGHVVQVAPHWALIAEQTPPDKAYILLAGEVDVRRRLADLGRCRPGEILGELGIVHRRLRSATVVTRTRATVLHLSRDAFETVRAEHVYFADLVGEAVTRKTA